MKTASIIFLALVLVPVYGPTAHAGEDPGRPGHCPDMSTIALAMDTSRDGAAYLGLDGQCGRTFNLSQIKAGIVIIEVFNIYCPHCQREAPNVNKLFDFIKDNKLDDKIKIIGVGFNSSDFGLEVFKFTFKIPFPLFSDRDSSICTRLGVESTPSFYVVRLQKNSAAKLVYETEKPIASPGDFIEKVFANTE